MRESLSALPITIILNAGSGHDDKEKLKHEIATELRAAGRQFRFLEPQTAQEIETLAKEAVGEGRTRPQMIVAAGGDGTINSVVAAVLGSELPIGILPMGTFNYFARDLGIPLEPAAAARVLLQGQLRSVHVATINDHVFLNNASFGLYRHLLEDREEFKHRLGRYKLVAVMAALATLWRHRRVYTVQLQLDGGDSGGQSLVLRTPMLFFGINALQLEKLDLEVARCAHQGLIAVIALRPMSPLRLLATALRGAIQGLREAKNLRCYGAAEVQVMLPGAHRTKVAVDGESIDCSLPLRINVMRNALSVVVPRHPPERK